MSPSSRYATAGGGVVNPQDIGRAIGAVLGELHALTKAIAILRRLEIEPGPDPVQQVIDLSRDVAQLVGAEEA
jgi:hypothetical protein